MNVGKTKTTKHTLNSNCYDVAPIAKGFNCEIMVQMVHHSQKHKSNKLMLNTNKIRFVGNNMQQSL